MNYAFVDNEKCVGCGKCIPACPRGCIELISGKAFINKDDCVGCMACERVCPQEAISIVVEAQIIPDKSESNKKLITVQSNNTSLLAQESTLKKVGRFLLHSSIAILSSPRVIKAIFGDNNDNSSQIVSGRGANAGKNFRKGRGRGRGCRSRKGF